MKYLILFVAAILFTSAELFVQDVTKCDSKRFEDELLNRLIGKWDLTGKIGNRSVKNTFSAEWILDHQFVELNFTDAEVPPSYTAKVFIGYDCVSERYVVHWLDSFGGRFSETLGWGIKSGNEIEFRFEYPDAPFINKFIYSTAGDGWHLHMTTKNKEGEWVVFGDEYLKRK